VIYIRGLNWFIVGSPLAGRYRVFQGSRQVFSLQPVELTGNYYHELKVDQQADEPLAILVASILDHWARRGQRDKARLRLRRPRLADNLGMDIKCNTIKNEQHR
ncbi:MAG TPA: hypothetical protein K8V26_06095, partial [Limosilactobacillus pontis]|nr:hypothetical protein [Limosilactobacillus pontis]